MTKWLTCAMSAPVVRRGLLSALIVGPVLVVINHGDAIAAGDISTGRLVRIALTFFVPYAVSTFSSVQALTSQPPSSDAASAATEACSSSTTGRCRSVSTHG
jgi:hypothetical protein